MRVPKELRRTNNPKKNWDADEYMGLNPSPIDWARLAAFVDGEGCIQLSPKTLRSGNQLFYGKVIITNTDFRLAKWLFDTFGINYYEHSNNSKGVVEWASCFFSQACSNKAAWLLRNALPHFILKREQAEIVLEHQRTKHVDYFERRAGSPAPKNVIDFQMSLKQRLAELNKRGRKTSEEVVTKKLCGGIS